VAVAIEGVEPTEFALIKNNLTQDVNQETQLSGGLHWVGVFYSLIHFPSVHKSIEFSGSQNSQYPKLNTRTKEGLELQLSFSFQYQLNKKQLHNMYLLCQQDYEMVFARIARNAILEEAGNYLASAYWLNRTAVGDKMKDNLENRLQGIYANLSGFMLLNIDLPDSYEAAIVQT